jgi:hypothetical protein
MLSFNCLICALVSASGTVNELTQGVDKFFITYERTGANPVTHVQIPVHTLSYEVLILTTADGRQYISDLAVGKMTGDIRPLLTMIVTPDDDTPSAYTPIMCFSWGQYSLNTYNQYTQEECLALLDKK